MKGERGNVGERERKREREGLEIGGERRRTWRYREGVRV